MTSQIKVRQALVAEQIPDHIKRVSKSLGYTLWLGGTDDWFGLSVILRARLAPEERVALALMALRSLDEEHVRTVFAVASELEAAA